MANVAESLSDAIAPPFAPGSELRAMHFLPFPAAEASPCRSALLARPMRPTTLARVVAYVDGALHRPDLTVRTIAIAVGVSRSVLYRHFASFGGIARFVRERRMAALHRAVASSGERRSFAEIARSCGYASPSHASRRFKACFGVAPNAYRRLARLGSV